MIRESKNSKKKRILEISVVLTALIIFTSFTDLPASLGYSVLAPIPVGPFPSGIAFDPTSKNVYVANFAGNSVSVINSTNNVSPIAVAGNPISVTAGNGKIYVANFFGNSVSVINTATNTVIGSPITVGANPSGIAFDPTSGNIYVASYATSSVSVINTATNTVIGSPITVGVLPYAIAIGNGKIYVANSGGSSVSVINTATNTVIGSPITVGANPSGIAFDPTSGNIYVASLAGTTVSVINTATNTVIGSPITVGAGPDGIAVGNGKIYVANLFGSSVSVINSTTNTVIGSPITLGTNPSWIAYNSANGNIYVVDPAINSVSIISTSNPIITPTPTPTGTGTTPTITSTDTTQPKFNTMSDIASFPTSTLGAIVTYSVTAQDPDPGDTVTVGCDHPSGSQFVIGTTLVNCTAKDTAGNNAALSFNVHVYTPIEGAGVMVNQLNNLNYLSMGTITSLDAKLPFSITMIPGGSADAKFKLYNFVNEINSKCCSDTGLTSKPFTSAQANKFITEANDIAAATP